PPLHLSDAGNFHQNPAGDFRGRNNREKVFHNIGQSHSPGGCCDGCGWDNGGKNYSPAAGKFCSPWKSATRILWCRVWSVLISASVRQKPAAGLYCPSNLFPEWYRH